MLLLQYDRATTTTINTSGSKAETCGHDIDFECDVGSDSFDDAIRKELSLNATKAKSVEPHERFGPLYKELSSLSKGDSDDDLTQTQKVLENLIQNAKQRRGLTKHKNTPRKIGNVVTCTMANNTEKYTRFKHKKQKLF